jgi:hypothetical protein
MSFSFILIFVQLTSMHYCPNYRVSEASFGNYYNNISLLYFVHFQLQSPNNLQIFKTFQSADKSTISTSQFSYQLPSQLWYILPPSFAFNLLCQATARTTAINIHFPIILRFEYIQNFTSSLLQALI